MRCKRDTQRSKVYAWEDAVIGPHDPTLVLFTDAQNMINAIWSDFGLRYPPSVEPLKHRQGKTIAAANRLSIFLRPRTPAWCLLHELAHAMTSTFEDGEGDGHGPTFMGMYLQMIVRYLRLDMSELAQSLNAAGIKYHTNARPMFTDA